MSFGNTRRGGAIYGSAVVTGGLVYFGSWDDRVHAPNATRANAVAERPEPAWPVARGLR